MALLAKGAAGKGESRSFPCLTALLAKGAADTQSIKIIVKDIII